jgi:hypothetical protein
MVNTFIDVVVKQPDGDVIINGVTNLNYMVSVKNLVSKLYIQVPLTKIEYNATSASSVNYGDISISIGDYVICQMGYTDIENIPSKYFDGYITTFVLTKTELTFEIESYSWLLKKLPRRKFSLNKTSVKDIILEATKGYSTDKKEYIEIKYGAYNPFKIYFEDLTFEGNFILKDPLSPFEVISMIADELEIYAYTSSGEEENKPGIYISKRSFADTKYYAYPYIKYKDGGTNYNFIIDIDIDQQNINLADYIVKANSTKSTIEKLKVAYAIAPTESGRDEPTFVDYTTERPTTIQIEYPSVDEATLKKLVVYAWDKLEAEKEKQGSFTTFIEQGVNLTDRIHINLYGKVDNHAVDSVETTFDTNSGLRQKVTLGKKLSTQWE